MASEYQMWLTFNGGMEKIRFPMLPEVINISRGSANQSVSIQGLGEVVIKQEPKAVMISFSSFFPSTPFPGVQFEGLTPPADLVSKIAAWQRSDMPVQLIITGTDINIFCVIEDFSTSEQGGDIGTLHYSLKLKEYKEVHTRQITVDMPTHTVIIPTPQPPRIDNRVPEQTYTVVKGDCLNHIAKRLLGNSSRWRELYELNRDIIKNPNLIFPGQVLRLPGGGSGNG